MFRVTQTRLLVILLRFLRETENKPPVSSDVSVGGIGTAYTAYLHMKVLLSKRKRGGAYIDEI
jgi:hypothetical protein